MFDPQGFQNYLAIALAAGVALYVYVAFALMVIARKTGTPNGWLAWVPIANLYLMCCIARRPAWWLLLMLIPVVNLVVFLIVWSGIARARSKPAWIGFLMIVPLVNLFIPAYLAAGPAAGLAAAPIASAPLSQGGTAGSICAQCGTRALGDELFCGECGNTLSGSGARPAARATPVRTCPNCGKPGVPGETFCGECGTALTVAATEQAETDQAETRKASPAKRQLVMVISVAAVLLAAVVILGRKGVFDPGLLSSFLNRQAPTKTQPVSPPTASQAPAAAPARSPGKSAKTLAAPPGIGNVARPPHNAGASTASGNLVRPPQNAGESPTITVAGIPKDSPFAVAQRQQPEGNPPAEQGAGGRMSPPEPQAVTGPFTPAPNGPLSAPLGDAQTAGVSRGNPPGPLVSAGPPAAARGIPAPAYSGPFSGTITFTGQLEKDGTFTIDGHTVSTGTVAGNLPGVPVLVEINAKDFALAEMPAPSNGWKRLVIRSKRRWQGTMVVKWTVAQ